jgi:hypothetical protein
MEISKRQNPRGEVSALCSGGFIPRDKNSSELNNAEATDTSGNRGDDEFPADADGTHTCRSDE